MLKTLPIEFVRQAIEQTLFEEHLKNINYFGGQDQIALHSFYEQLKDKGEIDRFVETYRDLTEQQNRTGLIGNGVLLSPENPTMTNLYSALIVPFTWTCSVRCTLENRDQMIWTLQNMIDKLKGRKCDIAQLECEDEQGRKIAKLFKVGTLGQGNSLAINSGDYIGNIRNSLTPTGSYIRSKVSTLINQGLANNLVENDYLYVGRLLSSNRLYVAQKYLQNATATPSITSIAINTTSIGGSYTKVLRLGLSISDFSSDYSDLVVHIVGIAVGRSGGTTYTYTFDKDATIRSQTLSGTTLYLDCAISLGTTSTNYTINEEDVNITSKSATYKTGNYREIEDDGTYQNVVFPPEHTNFEKYKLSMSFESFRVDEPRTLNSQEYCEISFGGSATLVNDSVVFGNDLVKLAIQKNKIISSSDITFNNATIYLLEPMEMPSGLNANTQISQLMSNQFKQNTHTDGTSCVLQYSFIYDNSIDILKQWFDYARFGDYGITSDKISPNMIYNLSEYWSSWGDVEKHTMLGKIVESIDIENTESDVLTLGLTFQIQGENN